MEWLAMRTVSIRDANQNFSRLVKEVEAGETVVITRQGKPVAELVPRQPSRLDDPQFRARFQQLRQRLREWPRDGYRLGKVTEEDKYGDAQL
jgi:prevent-host-death family protein